MTTPPPVTIREATLTDAAELARLNLLFNGSSDDTVEQLTARLAHSHRIETPILAEYDGRVIGFTALRLLPCVFYAPPYAEITELFVEEGYRQQGIGRALLVYAERLARAAGADELFVATDFENETALNLYRNMGFADYDLLLQKAL